MFDVHKFLFRSDWTLATSDGVDTWNHGQIRSMAEPIISDLAQLPARGEDQVFDFE